VARGAPNIRASLVIDGFELPANNPGKSALRARQLSAWKGSK
jgi:hypothetical protein